MSISNSPLRAPPSRPVNSIAQGFVIEDEPMPGTQLQIPYRAPVAQRASMHVYYVNATFVTADAALMTPMSNSLTQGAILPPARALADTFHIANINVPEVSPPDANLKTYVSNPSFQARPANDVYFIRQRYFMIEEEPMMSLLGYQPDKAGLPLRSPATSYFGLPPWFQINLAIEFPELRAGPQSFNVGRAASRAMVEAYQTYAKLEIGDEPHTQRQVWSEPIRSPQRSSQTAYVASQTFVQPDVDPIDILWAGMPVREARMARRGTFDIAATFVVPDVAPTVPPEILSAKVLVHFARAPLRSSSYETYVRMATQDDLPPFRATIAEVTRMSRTNVDISSHFVVKPPPEVYPAPGNLFEQVGVKVSAPPRAGDYTVTQARVPVPDQPMFGILQFPDAARAPLQGANSVDFIGQGFVEPDEVQTYRGMMVDRARLATRAEYWLQLLPPSVIVEQEFIPLVLQVPSSARSPLRAQYWIDARFTNIEEEFLPKQAMPERARAAARPGGEAFQVPNDNVTLIGQSPQIEILLGTAVPTRIYGALRPANSALWVNNPRMALDEPMLLTVSMWGQMPGARRAVAGTYFVSPIQIPEDLQGRSFVSVDSQPRNIRRSFSSEAYWVGLGANAPVVGKAGAVKGPFVLVAGYIYVAGAQAGFIYVAGAQAGYIAGAEAAGQLVPPNLAVNSAPGPSPKPPGVTPETLRLSVQNPGTVTVGAPFGLTVVVHDPNGNINTLFNGNLSVVLASNPGNATLSGPISVTANAGVASFSGLSLNQVAGGYTLTVSGQNVVSVTTSAFAVTALGVASQLVVTTQPPSVAAGASFGLTIKAEDGFGTIDATYTGNVSVALGSATLNGTATVAASAGVATFSGLSINAAGTYTLTGMSGSLGGTSTNAFTVTAGSATQLTAVGPGNELAAMNFSFQAQATDSLGNVDLTFAGNVTVAIGTNPSGGTLSGTLTQAAVNGIASFTNLQINNPGNGYTLQATASGLTTATSSAFNVSSVLVRVPRPQDWTWIGRFFGPTNFTDGGNAYGSCALRKQPSGTKSLMILGHGDGIGGQFVWEISIPQPTTSNFPRASLIQGWSSTFYSNNRVSTDPGHTSNNGIYFDIPTQRLFILYGLTYDVAGGGVDAPVIMFAQFDPVTGNYLATYGPWRVDVGHSKVRSGMMAIPPWFRPLVGGRSIAIFGGTYSGSSTASWGFDLFALDMPTSSTPPYVSATNPGTTLTTATLLFYPRLDPQNGYSRRYQRSNDCTPTDAITGKPLAPPGSNQFPTSLAPGTQPWTGADAVRGGCWPDTANVSGPVFNWSKPIMEGWYGEPTIPGPSGGTIQAACVGPAGKGQNASGYEAELAAFDPAILKQVALGQMASYAPTAAQLFDPTQQFPLSVNCRGLYTGMAWDNDTNRVYAVANKADFSAGSSTPGIIVDVYQLP